MRDLPTRDLPTSGMPTRDLSTSGQQRLEALQQQLQKAGSHLLMSSEWLAEKSTAPNCSDPHAAGTTISTGCAALDAWFPRGGMVRGQTIELVGSSRGAGAMCVAMILAKQICSSPVFGAQGLLVLIDRHQDFNPTILLALGFDLDHVLLVQPLSDEDHLWALEQALADSCVAAVWTCIDKLDKRYQRRWQLAAERGQAIGLLQRPEKVLGHPTWASLQFEVRPNPHSHCLTGNRRSTRGGAAPPLSSSTEWDQLPVDEAAEHWIVQLIARRSAGRFEATSLQLELCNRNWSECLEWQKSHPGAGASEWFFRQRLPHPNDPWFTKATPAELELELANSESPDTNASSSYSAGRRRNLKGSSSPRRRS